MTNVAGSASSDAAAIAVPRWALILFAVAAAIHLIDGLSVLPSPGGIVLAALAAAALFFVATARTQSALYAMAAILLLGWVSGLVSADETPGANSLSTALLFFGLPLIAVSVALLAWRGTRLTFATLLASLPTLLSVVLAFLLGMLTA